MNSTRLRQFVIAIPLSFLVLFYFYPLANIFLTSFRIENQWDPVQFIQLITKSYYLKTLWFTTWQALVSTLLTLLAAIPSAYVFAKYRFRGKSVLQAIATIPFVLPTVVVGAAFQALLGRHGLVNQWMMHWLDLASPPVRIDQTIWFILLAHVFYNYAIALRIIAGTWSRINPEFAEASRMMGASASRAFFKITLPLLMPAIVAAGLLVFVFCFSSFGVILILGGPRFSTIEVEIFRQAVHLFNLPMAAALSLFQMMFTFAIMWAYTGIQRRTTIALNPEPLSKTQRKPETKLESAMVLTNNLFMALLLGGPLLALMIRSVTTSDSGLSLIYYKAIFENRMDSVFFIPPVHAVLWSLGFAVMAMLMALVLGILAATYLSRPGKRLNRILDPLVMLPLSTSAVTLGFGFIITLDTPPLNLRASPVLVVIAHALVGFPFVVRSLLPALRSIPDNLRKAASVMGASPLRVWQTIDLPMVWRAVLVGGIFAFTISLGEFGATVFVARPQTPTMPLAIYRFLSQPGDLNYGQAMAMSTLLMVITALSTLFIEKFRIGQGDF